MEWTCDERNFKKRRNKKKVDIMIVSITKEGLDLTIPWSCEDIDPITIVQFMIVKFKMFKNVPASNRSNGNV